MLSIEVGVRSYAPTGWVDWVGAVMEKKDKRHHGSIARRNASRRDAETQSVELKEK